MINIDKIHINQSPLGSSIILRYITGPKTKCLRTAMLVHVFSVSSLSTATPSQ